MIVFAFTCVHRMLQIIFSYKSLCMIYSYIM